jgi:hypothetical protein
VEAVADECEGVALMDDFKAGDMRKLGVHIVE